MQINPDIYFDDENIPHSKTFGDSYYSKSGGFDECKFVFHAAADIPNIWQEKPIYTIGELGFGTGLNFLCTWHKWDEWLSAQTTEVKNSSFLNFISFEKYPLAKDIAKTAHENWPEIAHLSEKLIQNWPHEINGVQRIVFPESKIALTIIIGDARETIKNIDFKADTWFFDGFAPMRNPELWEIELLKEVKNHSKPDVKIGTYSVAAMVRNNLAEAGFIWEKKKGFAFKRERLEAYLPDSGFISCQTPKPKILIIGAGIAGATVYNELKQYGIEPIICEDDIEGLYKTSNNKFGIIMPRLDRLDNKYSHFFKTIFLRALDFYKDFKGFHQTGIIEAPKTERDFEKYQLFASHSPLPENLAEFYDDKIIHKLGGYIEPKIVIKDILKHANIINTKINRIQKIDNKFHAYAENDLVAIIDEIILCCGQGVLKFINAPELNGKLGAINIIEHSDIEPETPQTSSGYIVKTEGLAVIGATYDLWDLDRMPVAPINALERNIENTKALEQELFENLIDAKITSRASVRVTYKDTFPIIGKLDDYYIMTALGSKGFTSAILGAQIIAAQILNLPMPVENDIIELIAPKRVKFTKK